MTAALRGGAAFADLAPDTVSRTDPSFFGAPISGAKIAEFLDRTQFARPTLVVDVDRVEARYQALSRGLKRARIHFAVKANPAPEIVARLVNLGSGFDAASRGEIELCLAQGADRSRISFGNTIKRAADIAWAHGIGIDLFAADAEEELVKLASHAPGARVYLRLLVEHSEADWPLSRKFGCPPEEAMRLIGMAWNLGLKPCGLSFHVGSQTREPAMWGPVLDMVAQVWREARAAGFPLEMLNIGGGFPASYETSVRDPESYARDVLAEIEKRIGSVPFLMAEPGRGLVAEAGAIAAEVLLVGRKRPTDIARWVYLDIGRFSGLAETEGEAIRYRIEAETAEGETGPCVLAGPSCDSADVLYERRPVQMPLDLKAGDRVRIHGCGAYTSTYSSVGFNGFPPLDVICI